MRGSHVQRKGNSGEEMVKGDENREKEREGEERLGEER